MAVGIRQNFKNGARRAVVRLQEADTTLTTHNGASVGSIPVPSGGKGLLQVNVTAFAGGTNVTVKVQHSVDGTAWADVTGATTAALTATGAVLVAFNGPVGPYVRAVSTVTGVFTQLNVTTDVYVTD